MYKRRLTAGIGAAAVLVCSGQAQAAPALRVQVEQKGDFVLIGNTLAHDCVASTPAPVVGTVGNCGSNTSDSGVDVFWRSDAPGAGQAQANTSITLAQARSTAQLTLPAGATVSHAFLYWAASGVAADGTVTVDRPGAFSQTVTAGQTHAVTGGNQAYEGVADITALVQAQGPGAYRLADANALNLPNLTNNTAFAGWWMVVFYQLATDPPRNLALFDGLDVVANGANQNVTLNGFLVPPAFGSAKLGVVAFEGDTTLTGDQFFFNGGAALTNALNPANNFFNRTRSALGTAVSVVGDLPQLTGTAGSLSGMDLDIVDITSKLAVGQTSAPIQATSTGDVYWLGGFVTSIPTFKPDFNSSQKSAVDVNGGALLPGDIVEYTIQATNTGNDAAIGTVMNDALPVGVTFVPGSIQITAGDNQGIKTDPVADDQCEYLTATRTVRCRLGAGANGTSGGQMAEGASSTIVFRVTIDLSSAGTINNQAIITAAGLQGAPAADTPTDGNGSSSGTPPTPVVVDACVDDTLCASPTPHCNTAMNPNACVQCLQDAHCAGLTPTCDVATGACVCVPSGPELCDGKDNDCNGTVDDGDPGAGSACATGLAGACAAGTTACTSGAIVCVPSLTPGQQAEACDNLDNDCDGTVDNGNPGGGQACQSGLPGVCDAGTTSCTGGSLQCNATVQPGQQAESCNGQDDDCNGTLDDGFNVGAVCSAGVGQCLQAGTVSCVDATTAACNAVALPPQPEICGDSLDSDCDGQNDNGCGDTDGDGLADYIEMALGTGVNDTDSDDDGVRDGDEHEYDKDTDGDGLINALDPDSDDDGLLDGTELGKDCSDPGTNASVGNCRADGDQGATVTDPLDKDTDDGGVSDGAEDTNLDGKIDTGETDPNLASDDQANADGDGDGLSDKLEQQIGTDPADADSDDDGVIDGSEANPTEDTDGDGLINAMDPDSDNDGLFDGTELGKDCSNAATDLLKGHCVADADQGATTTSPLNKDTDGGGVQDGSEDANGNGMLDAGELDPNDPADDATVIDTDGDGLSDAAEASIGTDPNDADSDDDGVIDGLEPNVSADTDGDGDKNGMDADSDGDGLLDGTEMGLDCTHAATDLSKGHCVADGDQGATTTSPVDADTDNGTVLDGNEDANHNGVVDPGETDPNDGADDVATGCSSDADCGSTTSGKVCHASGACVDGCRGTGGNGCPSGQVCSSVSDTIGSCGPATDGGAGGSAGDAGKDGSAGDSGTAGKAGDSGTAGKAGAAGGAGSAGKAGASGDAGTEPEEGASLEGGGCACSTKGPRSHLPLGLAMAAVAALFRRRRKPR